MDNLDKEQSTPFKKINDKKRSTYVIEQTTGLILEGHYSSGDKLPPERVISNQVGVSRTAVREALRTLETVGIITRRQGDGTYVQSTDEELLSQVLAFHSKGQKVWHVFQLQSLLEPTVAVLAAREASDDDIKDMEKALGDMSIAVEKEGFGLYFSSDRQLHLAIAMATGNPLVVEQVKLLLERMNDELWRSFKALNLDFDHEEGYFTKSLKVHRELIESIKEKELDKIKRIMENHFDRVAKKLFGGDQPDLDSSPHE